MAMSWVWTGMVVLSLAFGAATGRLNELGAAALAGAAGAVELCVSMAGVLCLWSGVMEVLRQSGLIDRLALAFRPLLRRLLPEASRDRALLADISANVSANLLGLGNAATPPGLRAAEAMARANGGRAGDELCLFIVLNTASLQLLPTTVAGIRAALGAAEPFAIVPAVWLASAASLAAGLTAAKLLARLWRDRA